ncbi:MAG: hypothetical protein HC897_13910 [Thermoanaerobaculia bacterium]|nr:hypothetical protein [Thermoanaerobaculia bacterium]
MPSLEENNQAIGDGVTASPQVMSRGERTRHDLRLITLAWVFGATWMWTINGAVMTQFARGLGTPDWAFGLIATMPFIGVLFQLRPGGFWIVTGFAKSPF